MDTIEPTADLIQGQALPEATHQDMANAIRALAMDAVQKANSGHPGMPMGMADVATVLFTRFLKFDAAHPDWPDRDRFVLSAGHGSMLLYALLYLTGYPDMEHRGAEALPPARTRAPRATPNMAMRRASRPPPVRSAQGLGNAVGMALAERLLNRRYGDEIVDHHTYCVAGDGCLMEGISQEAISLAGHLKLGRLIVLFDDNHISIDGPTSLSVSDDQIERFKASRLAHGDASTVTIRKRSRLPSRMRAGHRPALADRLPHGHRLWRAEQGRHRRDPRLAARRRRDRGRAREARLAAPPFEVPKPILASWRAAGTRHAPRMSAGTRRRSGSTRGPRRTRPIPSTRKVQRRSGPRSTRSSPSSPAKAPSSRRGSPRRRCWRSSCRSIPGLIGGSADLTGSNGTLTKLHTVVKPGDFAGNYIHYGVREHGMAAAMNGMALHGGIVPYGGTFLVFTDYCRPSIRLSALMQQRVIYVMTHDSIGLGEDGPTHQPVEHLAALRAIPNLNVFRPADSVECAECWEIALLAKTTPSILALTRQGVPLLRTAHRPTRTSPPRAPMC